MQNETHIGGSQTRFPTTRRSAIQALKSRDDGDRRRAFEAIAAVYWKPVYTYIRIKWGYSNEDAKDLTQLFFIHAIEGTFFNAYDSSKARFRTFLRLCLDRFLTKEDKAAKRIKRGGGIRVFSFDFSTADRELAGLQVSAEESPEDLFDREWMRHLFTLAIQELRRYCIAHEKELPLQLFERYDLSDSDEQLTYESLAHEFNVPVTQVTNYLSMMQHQFRKIVLEKLQSITMNEEEFHREARIIFGITPS